jgi:hypothetical protein
MTDHQNDVSPIAVIVDVQDLLTEATQALLDRDWKRAANATDLADKLLRGTVAPGVNRRPRKIRLGLLTSQNEPSEGRAAQGSAAPSSS